MSEHYPNPYKRIPFAELELEKNPRPRESISESSIEDMASSILAHGIIQPLPSRVIAGIVKPFIGQRRFLGFQRALARVAAGEQPAEGVDLSTVPVLLEDIDDRTMLERQCIENLQREDVHPRDEAAGYLTMTRELGYTMTELSKRLGKEESYVSHRLVLVGIPDLMWKAYDEKRVTISHLEVVGSVPNALDREEFAKLILGGKYGDKVLSVKDAQEVKQNRFVVSLRACGFDKEDAKLVPMQYEDGERSMGGACDGCPFMQGKDKAPLCVNLRCFRAKQDAAWRVIADNAENLGRRVMHRDRASEIFASDGSGELLEASGLVDLAGKLRYMDTGHHNDDTPTWESLGLGQGSAAMAMAIVARHPKTNRVHHLLERADAIKCAIEADPGNAKLFANRPGMPKPKSESPEPKARQEREPEPEIEEDVDDQPSSPASVAEEQTAPVVTGVDYRARMKPYIDDVVKFVRVMRHGSQGEEDEVLNVIIEAAATALTTDGLRVLLEAIGGDDIDTSIDWERDAIVRMIRGATRDPAVTLFATLVTQLRLKQYAPMITALAKLPELTEARLVDEAKPESAQREITIEERAWQMFVGGAGKGTIGKALGISENTVGAWQKRHWPSRDELNRYLESIEGSAANASEITVEAVKEWLVNN